MTANEKKKGVNGRKSKRHRENKVKINGKVNLDYR